MTHEQFRQVMAMLWLIVAYLSVSVWAVVFAGFMAVYWLFLRPGDPR